MLWRCSHSSHGYGCCTSRCGWDDITCTAPSSAHTGGVAGNSDQAHCSEQLQAHLTEPRSAGPEAAQLTEAQPQLKAAEAVFSKKLEEQTQSSIARENAVKDSCQQRINALDSTAEALSQRIRARNMVVHGLPAMHGFDNESTSSCACVRITCCCRVRH